MYETELANLLTSPPVITWSQLTCQIDIAYFFPILYLCIKCNSNLHTFPEASLKRLWAKHLPNKLNRLYRNFEWGLIYPWMSALDYNHYWWYSVEDQWTADRKLTLCHVLPQQHGMWYKSIWCWCRDVTKINDLSFFIQNCLQGFSLTSRCTKSFFTTFSKLYANIWQIWLKW